MLKLAACLVLTMGLVLTPLYGAWAEFRVGVVDGMDIVSKSAEGRRVQDNLKRKSEELGRPFALKRQDFARQVEEFQKQSTVMKDAAKQRKAAELEKKAKDLERQGADAQKQLSQYQQTQMTPLLQKLDDAVKAVAQENKLDIVLDKRNSGLLYMSPSLDITDKVRARFGR